MNALLVFLTTACMIPVQRWSNVNPSALVS